MTYEGIEGVVTDVAAKGAAAARTYGSWRGWPGGRETHGELQEVVDMVKLLDLQSNQKVHSSDVTLNMLNVKEIRNNRRFSSPVSQRDSV